MLRLLSLPALLVCTLLSPVNVCGQDRGFSALRARVAPLVEAHQGDVSVVVLQPDSGEQLSLHGERVMPTASLIKVAVMVTAYRAADDGSLDLASLITLTEDDMVPGSGILTDQFSEGLQISVRDAIRLMMRYSDNTATNLVVNQLGLPRIAEVMQELGLAKTRLHSLVSRGDTSIDPEQSKAFGLGRTTATEMVQLLELIRSDTAASAQSCAAMRAHLKACEDGTKLARFFPNGTEFFHKTGAVSGARTDAGFLKTDVGPMVICVLTAKNKDRSWKEDNAAEVLLGRIGQAVLESFAKPWDADNDARPDLRIGAFGEMVEALQRTLNARLESSPNLSIDGDFGPATQSAVVMFEEQAGLESDGVVDPEVWKALGPLQFASAEIPPPDEINSLELPREPSDPDTGPPFVTCRAWAALDLESGIALAGDNAESRLPMASTTKIMTAWLVLRLAEQDPTVLEEFLTFSRRADQTRGSTAAVREGEFLPVSDALYGLLLPSGNDASVALAEHFGERAAALLDVPDVPEGATDPLESFVAAMNLEAARLGLEHTNFSNPHGLDNRNHHTSALDLAELAATAFESQRFRTIVNTRRFGCRLTGRGGYTRHIAWDNTNALLATEGYSGVKTGTTSKAGACLVSVCKRDGHRTLLVVLGSAVSAARYTDSRNLHRWVQQVRNLPQDVPASGE